jgi:serine/threonine protein kinase
MAPRPPAAPPDIAGFTYERLLGSGGYADVFLYHQLMPRREVAIKVLVPDSMRSDLREQFTAEANLMAELSAHPAIVTIFQADIAPDGRPYLVMELYPRDNFGVRARTEQLGVGDVLRTAVQVAGAVETAHRAGILHRDIKPANILTSAYGRPGLTDFGIAVNSGDAESAEGMSIPWSPPEVIDDSAPADVRADVYSLAATIYTLLAARSPFEVPGGANGNLELIDRIRRTPVPPIDRGDVPPSLERVLAQAMAKNPAHRPDSAASLARSLQEIESELHLAMTALDIVDDVRVAARPRGGPDDEGETRISGSRRIDAQPVDPYAPLDVPTAVPRTAAGFGAQPDLSSAFAPPMSAGAPQGIDSPTQASARRGVGEQVGFDSVPPPVAPQPTPPTRSRRRPMLVGAAAVVVLGLGGWGVAALVGHSSNSSSTTTSSGGGTGTVVTHHPTIDDSTPDPPTDVQLVRQGTGVIVSWQPADGADTTGLTYELSVQGGATIRPAISPYTIPNAAQTVCVNISAINREGQPSVTTPTACAS